MGKNTIEVSDSDFDTAVLGSNVPVLVDFWAPWCGPCLAVAPVLEELAQEFDGRVVVAKVNTDVNQEHAFRLGVRGIPTMILFAGGQEVERVVGARPKAAIKEMLERRAPATAVS